MHINRLDRRNFLKLLGLGALGTVGACSSAPAVGTVVGSATPAALALPTIRMFPTDSASERASASAMPIATAAQPSPRPPTGGSRKRVLRIAHLTDFHVLPNGAAPDGMRRALRRAQAEDDPPDMIFNTGDCVMDSLETDKRRVQAQWEAFKSILNSDCKLPIVHAIGNHDVWGWGLPDSTLQSDPQYGKELAVENLGLQNRYYSFDRAGWHFVVLDSTHPRNAVSEYPYIGRLDEEQYAWFINEIRSSAAAGSTPICILSHIPIVAACEYFDGENEKSGNWVVPAAWMHIDARRFREEFVQMPQVRLCLSGHTHQYESLDYLGVRYVTSGAVCGNWWRGAYMNFPPAYVMVDIYDDGSSDSTFVPYDA